MANDQLTEAKLREIELIHDYLKHITTLSTGSILLIVAFLEKLFPRPEWKSLIGVTLVGFCVSIIAALGLQFLLLSEMDPDTPSSEKLAQFLFILMAVAFMISILSVAVFAFKNLF